MENGQPNGAPPTPNNSPLVYLDGTETILRERPLPRYSVDYNGQSVDVFADIRRSQVYYCAHEYFQTAASKSSTNNNAPDPDITVESMDVCPISSPREDTNAGQRPQSILYDDDECSPTVGANAMQQIFPGMYVSKNIGPEGGSISVQGAKLTVPVGALTVSTRIRLGIVWKPNCAPPLGDQQALLSSVVACEPHGLPFQVPVNLEIQHCAQMRKEWELYIVRSNTSVREGEVRF